VDRVWGKYETAIMSQPVDDQESIHAVGDDNMKKIIYVLDLFE